MIRGFEKTILFDTGKDGAVLMRNLRRLNIASSDIDVVVLSHAHRDHTGGLEAFLAANPRVDVYLLSSSPRPLFEVVRKHGANPVPVKGRAEICRNVSTTGALGTDIEEHALVLRTRTGLVVITGCAHPGIVRILQRVKEDFPSSDILLAMGGFHLLRSRGLVGIIDEMRALGVRYVAPCHCSGRAAKRLFRQRFKERSIALWAGARIRISGGEEPCAEPTCMTIF